MPKGVITVKPIDKFEDVRLKHVAVCTDVLKAIGLEHLVDDVYEAIRDHEKKANFNPERIE